jgi:Holliday junction resolvase RusA-like endonuclease
MNDQANGIHLMLPFPEAILNPNKHVHWAKKNKARVSAREAGYYLALEKGVKLNADSRYDVTLVFCPPDHRERDLDNLTASMKSALDGMCRGLGINDKMIRPVPDWGPLVEGGKVEITIVERKEIGA